MLSIIRTKDEEGYATDGVGIKLTHQLNRNWVEEIIRQAKDLYGEGFVREAAGIPRPATVHNRYMVSFDGGIAPTVQHPSLAEAESEARRLLLCMVPEGDSRIGTTARILRLEKTLKVEAAEPKIIEVPYRD